MSFGGYPFADWGPIVGPVDVDWALIAQLQLWLPTYLGQVRADYGVSPARKPGMQPSQPAPPQDYDNVIDMAEMLDKGRYPAIFVMTAQTTRVRGGQNTTYEAQWRSEVYCVVRGRVAREAKWLANYYETAIRRVLLQKGASNPPDSPENDQQSELLAASASIISKTIWTGTKIAPVANTPGDGRYLSAGIGTYTVITDKAVQAFGGPNVPNAAPYTPLVPVSEVNINIEATNPEDTQ